ncbi:DUF805 domain-containing protein [Ensifer canadensis]
MNLQIFTSLDGRIGRQTWWLAMIVLLIATVVAIFAGAALLAAATGGQTVSADGTSYMHLLIVVILLASIGFALAVNVKRWHDREMSGWWNLALFVPIVGPLFGLVVLGFLRGDEGSNRFGASGVVEFPQARPRFGRAPQ